MFARLGFAVAIHVDSDIFLADEVLAVGDRPFKKKCLEKMQEIRDERPHAVLRQPRGRLGAQDVRPGDRAREGQGRASTDPSTPASGTSSTTEANETEEEHADDELGADI